MEEYLERLQEFWRSDTRKWVVCFRNPVDIWRENYTFLLCELVFYAFTFLTFKHAYRHGGRYLHLWFTALFHGLVVESLSYFLPDIDSFWHARSTIVFLGERLPLHIAFFYPCVHYTTNVAAARLKLRPWMEPFAVAIGDVLVDLPFDIMGVKLLWWTWHDTDPNIEERSYSVPLTSYLFHMMFASSFTLILNMSHLLLTGSTDRDKYSSNQFSEFVCMVLTACLSMPLAAFTQFLLFYNLLHDWFGVSSEACVWLAVGAYVVIVWSCDRDNPEGKPANAKSTRRQGYFGELTLVVVMHYLFYAALVLVCSAPEGLLSTGKHQTIGSDCSHASFVTNVLGMELPKKTHLCPSSYDEPYFTLNCSTELQLLASPSYVQPSDGAGSYTVCGTPYPNYSEYKVVILASCALGMAFFWQTLFRSSPPPFLPPSTKLKVKKS